MTQYLLALYHADTGAFPRRSFGRLCVDVPAFDDKLTDAGAFVFHGGVLVAGVGDRGAPVRW